MKPVELDHFRHYHMLCGLSSNGKDALALLDKRADPEENRYRSDLCLFRNGILTRLTSDGQVSRYWWLDEDRLVFSALRTERDRKRAEEARPLTALYCLSIQDPGEAEEFLRLDYQVLELLFLTPQKFLFTARYDRRLEKIFAANEGSPAQAADALEEEKRCQVFDELPFWENGKGVSNGVRERLYLYEDGTVTPLTDEWSRISRLRFSPDRNAVVYTSCRYTDVQKFEDRIFRLNLATLECADISLGDGFTHYNYAVTADGLVVQGCAHSRYGFNENGLFYHIRNGSVTMLDDQYRYCGFGTISSDCKLGGEEVWQCDGEQVCFLSTQADDVQIMTADLKTDTIAALTKRQGVVQELALLDGALYMLAMRDLGGTELYRVDQDGTETRMTSLNTSVPEEYSLQAPEELFFTNKLGTEIHGWIIKPVDFEPAKQYPAILNIHGGPKMAFGTVVFHEMQYWASRGYAVLFCNPTGSEGRGMDFADMRGKYGTVDYEDLMQFVDTALDRHGWIDPQRLGVTGGSYGGFMTNWIIGHTDRFRAAASQRSIANWITMTGTTDIGYYFSPDQLRADIWTNPELMWEKSPLKYADRCTTPTLFIHSDEDYRCWLAEGLQMFTALKRNGCTARLCLFHGENHELSRSGSPKSRMRRIREITEWFDAYLK